MQHLPPALAPLAAYRQFIAYRLEAHPEKPGKTLKKPLNIHTGRVHDPHDAGAWVSFEQAAKFAEVAGDRFGVGFVFTANDPFWFLDIDECLDAGPPPRWNDVAAVARPARGYAADRARTA
jgi:primase-polymerase (primpol)-like protein